MKIERLARSRLRPDAPVSSHLRGWLLGTRKVERADHRQRGAGVATTRGGYAS